MLAYQKKINFIKFTTDIQSESPDVLNFISKKGILEKGKSFIKKKDDYFTFHKENFGTFKINKDAIHYDLVKNFSKNIKLAICLNQPIACNAYLNDFFVMHCSAFCYKNRAYLILGDSGSGKSTLLFHLLPYAKFITEDIGILDSNKHIYSSFPITKITDENINHKFIKSKEKISFDERGRFACMIKDRYFKKNTTEISGIFYIHRGETEVIKSLSPSKKLSAIYRSAFRQLKDIDARYEAKFFKRAGVLSDLKGYELNIASNECASVSAKKIINYLDDNF